MYIPPASAAPLQQWRGPRDQEQRQAPQRPVNAFRGEVHPGRGAPGTGTRLQDQVQAAGASSEQDPEAALQEKRYRLQLSSLRAAERHGAPLPSTSTSSPTSSDRGYVNPLNSSSRSRALVQQQKQVRREAEHYSVAQSGTNTSLNRQDFFDVHSAFASSVPVSQPQRASPVQPLLMTGLSSVARNHKDYTQPQPGRSQQNSQDPVGLDSLMTEVRAMLKEQREELEKEMKRKLNQHAEEMERRLNQQAEDMERRVNQQAEEMERRVNQQAGDMERRVNQEQRMRKESFKRQREEIQAEREEERKRQKQFLDTADASAHLGLQTKEETEAAMEAKLKQQREALELEMQRRVKREQRLREESLKLLRDEIQAEREEERRRHQQLLDKASAHAKELQRSQSDASDALEKKIKQLQHMTLSTDEMQCRLYERQEAINTAVVQALPRAKMKLAALGDEFVSDAPVEAVRELAAARWATESAQSIARKAFPDAASRCLTESEEWVDPGLEAQGRNASRPMKILNVDALIREASTPGPRMEKLPLQH